MTREEKKQQYLQSLPIADKIERKHSVSLDDLLTEEGLLLVQCMVRDGASMTDLAEAFGIKQQTFYLWRQKHPELQEACEKGKQIVDYQVENALLKAALGYKTTTTKIYLEKKPGRDGMREVRMEQTTSEVGPNTTACLAWLNNRKPEQWKRNRDNEMQLEDKHSGITINIVKSDKGKDEDDWEADVEE